MSTNTNTGSSRFSTVSGRLGLLSMAFVVALVVPAWLARAELGEQAETGAAINVAGRQRMLTQRIAKNAQIVFHDARNAAASEELAGAANLFSSTLDDLREGNATTGIAQLTDAEQTQVRADVEAMWAPVRSAVSTLLDGSTEASGRAAALATIMGNEAELLGRSNDLVKLIEASSKAGSSTVMAMITALLGLGFAYLVASWFVVRTGVVAPLKRAIESLARTTDVSLEGAKSVSESSKSLAASVTNSAASLEETAASLEEMSSITRSNADNSAKANAIAVRTKGSSTEGAELVAELETSIQAMCDSSAEMSKIVKSIEAIAFQTNLLALNAAVEAARAGEHGKGFAVVAEEVRSLAQRAAEATRSTANLIEESHQRTTEGLDSTTRVARSLHEIRTSAEELASLVQEISSAGSEMAEGIGQINTAVTQLDQVTQANSLGAESSAESADEIYERTQGLVEIRGQLESLVGANAGSVASFGAPNSKAGSSASKSAEKDSKKKSATVDGPDAALPAAAADSQDELEEVLPLGGDDFEEF